MALRSRSENQGLPWEFLGVQELWNGPIPGKGYAYKIEMWRTKVPGGWLLLSVNAKSSDPVPVQSFYPDPTHSWTGRTSPEAGYLLRPSSGDASVSSEALLRGSSAPPLLTDLKQIEE